MSPDPAAQGGVLPAVVPLRLPSAATLFAHRSNRLRALAAGHAAQDWLLALADLCAAQEEAVRTVPAPLPHRELARSAPLRAAEWPRSEAFPAALAVLLQRLSARPLPTLARDAVHFLVAAAPPELSALSDALLAGRFDPSLAAAAPFLAAALQVYFTSLAAQLDPRGVEPATRGCPVCASPAVAGAIQGDDKVRYLRCGLCGCDWHLVRVECATCRSGASLSYAAIAGAPAGTRAEVCAGCKTYLKIFSLEDLPGAEPLADDVASLALDLLLAEEGYARGGLNLLLAPPTSSGP